MEPFPQCCSYYLCAMKILMVCLGNICRSPLAEGLLQKKSREVGLNWIVDSAGTNSYHLGEAPHHLSQKVGRLHGVDISCQVARRFRAEDLEEFDCIYAMAEDVLQDMISMVPAAAHSPKLKLFLEELYPGENRSVPDPWYGAEDGYHEVFDLLSKTCDAVINNYKETTKAQQISHD